MKKNILITLIIVAICLIGLWIYTSSVEVNRQIEESARQNQSNQSQSAKAENLKIVETENGRKVWELVADKAVYENKNAKLINVKGQFYSKGDKILLKFQAPEGFYIQEKHELSLDKGVQIDHPDAKVILQAKTMSWTNKSSDVTAKGNVKIIKKGFGTSYGDKSVFSTDFSKIKIEGNTYTEVNYSG